MKHRLTALMIPIFCLTMLVVLVEGCAVKQPLPPKPIDKNTIKTAVDLGLRLFAHSRLISVAQSTVMALDPALEKKLHYVVIEPSSMAEDTNVIALDFSQVEPRIEAEVAIPRSLNLSSCTIFKGDSSACIGARASIKTRSLSKEEMLLATTFRQLVALEQDLEKCTHEAPLLLVLKTGQGFNGYVLSTSAELDQYVLSGHWRIEFSPESSLLNRKPLYKKCLVRTAKQLLGRHNHDYLTRPQTISLNTPVSEFIDESHIFLALKNEVDILLVGTALRMLSITRTADDSIQVKESEVVYDDRSKSRIYHW